jgi:hypothetical protein
MVMVLQCAAGEQPYDQSLSRSPLPWVRFYAATA